MRASWVVKSRKWQVAMLKVLLSCLSQRPKVDGYDRGEKTRIQGLFETVMIVGHLQNPREVLLALRKHLLDQLLQYQTSLGVLPIRS
jgi:hypothetical protein